VAAVLGGRVPIIRVSLSKDDPTSCCPDQDSSLPTFRSMGKLALCGSVGTVPVSWDVAPVA
jgi:hypothetical protein